MLSERQPFVLGEDGLSGQLLCSVYAELRSALVQHVAVDPLVYPRTVLSLILNLVL